MGSQEKAFKIVSPPTGDDSVISLICCHQAATRKPLFDQILSHRLLLIAIDSCVSGLPDVMSKSRKKIFSLVEWLPVTSRSDVTDKR